MTNKEIVQNLLQRIPDDTPLEVIAEELRFLGRVQRGLSELDRGESVSIEEVERNLHSWIK